MIVSNRFPFHSLVEYPKNLIEYQSHDNSYNDSFSMKSNNTQSTLKQNSDNYSKKYISY